MTTPRVSCEGLSLRYRPSAPLVFDGVSATFEPGTMTVLTGPSGSGKSTLLYVLALLMRPSAGRVRWGGVHASDRPDGERARLRAAHAGFVFQDAMLDPARSVLDNVCESALFAGIPRSDAERRANDLLDEFGIRHRAAHRPGEVSGGQAQRVGLCRALIGDPGIIFGDEPTGNLDPEAAAVVWDALQARAESGATVIVATHDRAAAARYERHLTLT